MLRQNRRKLTVDPGSHAFQERLQTEYDASLAVLLPLKRRLAATDRLIDQVVYRLYGLTERRNRHRGGTSCLSKLRPASPTPKPRR